MPHTNTNTSAADLVETLRECAEMTEGGRQAGLSDFWHDETVKVVGEVCTEAADTIERLSAELAAKHDAFVIAHEQAMDNGSEAARLEAENRALSARLARAEAALEPFAKAAETLGPHWRDHETQWAEEDLISVGHLRAARAYFASKEQADAE